MNQVNQIYGNDSNSNLDKRTGGSFIKK